MNKIRLIDSAASTVSPILMYMKAANTKGLLKTAAGAISSIHFTLTDRVGRLKANPPGR
jgi:hypothetical protein